FDGWPFALTDTAGVRSAEDPLEEEGIRRTQQSVEDADLVCLVVDSSMDPTDEDQQLLADLQSRLPANRLLVIANKSDLHDEWGEALPDGALQVSSLTQAGLATLTAEFVSRLVGTPPDRGLPLPVTQRQATHLRRALDAVRKEDQTVLASELIALRDGYRPEGSSS
ncbi:MAG: GTPase, partial [Planctomycetota bacterium]